jgi:hypothetical protein
MDRFDREALDRYITGNYGEDSVPNDDKQVEQDGLWDEWTAAVAGAPLAGGLPDYHPWRCGPRCQVCL